MQAVERIALAQLQMLRGMRLESGLFTDALDSALNSHSGTPITPLGLELLDGNMPVTRTQNRNFALAEGLRRLLAQSNLWSLLMRYQAQAERQYRRAVEELQRLRSLPPQDSPKEPISLTQPIQKDEVLPLEEINFTAPRDYEYHPEAYRADRNQSPSPVPCPPSPNPMPSGS